MRNGIPLAAVSELTEEIRQDPQQGQVVCGVGVDWQNGTRALISALPLRLGAQQISRGHSWVVDEPRQLGGGNHGPSPQELLLGGVGACIMVGFTVGASVLGVQLESLRVEVRGEMDLSGFLGLSEQVPLRRIDVRIEVKGDGTPEQFETLRREAIAHSPNAMTVAQGVALNSDLQIL
jgi:uncharacterized OsmC-like protein